MGNTIKDSTIDPDDPNRNIDQEDKMMDEVTQAREKFLEDVQKLGFPVCIQGRKALEQRQQDDGNWTSRLKHKQEEPSDAVDGEKGTQE